MRLEHLLSRELFAQCDLLLRDFQYIERFLIDRARFLSLNEHIFEGCCLAVCHYSYRSLQESFAGVDLIGFDVQDMCELPTVTKSHSSAG